MCVSRCLRCVGVSLVPMAIICMLSNILLLLPELKLHFLLEGHVTREATWATGLWGSGILCNIGVLTTDVVLGLTEVTLCLQMLCQSLYSCIGLLAASSCTLVSATALLCGLNILNSGLGLILGQGFGHNK
ncbi:hypothetical protein XENOCAPTIV_013927, partial [Xenoophorus captivus]